MGTGNKRTRMYADFGCKTNRNNKTSHYFPNLHSFSMNCCVQIGTHFTQWAYVFLRYSCCFSLIFSYMSPFFHEFFCFVLFCIAALTYHIDHSVRTCYWLDINTTGCIHAQHDHASIGRRTEKYTRSRHPIQELERTSNCYRRCVCSLFTHYSHKPLPHQHTAQTIPTMASFFLWINWHANFSLSIDLFHSTSRSSFTNFMSLFLSIFACKLILM